jgi:TonB family protein
LKCACWLFLPALLCVPPSVAQPASSTQARPDQAESSSSTAESLNILKASTLETTDEAPFVLRVEYQLYDLEGNPGIKGKAEAAWTKNDGEMVSIESPSLEVGGGPLVDAYEAADRESYLVRQAMHAIVRPFPGEAFGTLRCLSGAGAEVAYAQNGIIYHLSSQNHIFLMVDHLSVVERSNFRQHGNHEVPSDIKLSYEGRTALTMHVTDLGSISDSSDSRGGAAGMPKPIQMRPQVLDAVLLPHKPVKYPFSADYQRLGGGVRLVAVVTMEGKIADLDLIAGPQKSLAKAVSDAVRSWTFQPHLEKGAPAEFETTIDVDFNPRK